MFEPSPDEIARIPDTLAALLAEGRRLMRTPESRSARLKEQQEESAARAAIAAQRAMERFQWRPRASIALVNRSVCYSCHASTMSFSGFGVAMYRNSDASERIVMTPTLDPAFPRETHYTDSITASCLACLDKQGFHAEYKNGET